MKILIVRMWADILNIKNYNCQEVGLAKALIRKGHQCDIVLYTDKESREEYLEFESGKIRIYYLKAKNILKNCFFEKKIYDIIQNYDVIQTAEYDQIGNIKLRRKLNNKMVIYHGPYSSKYTKGYNKKCLISDIFFLFNKKYKKTPCLSKSKLATQLLKSKGFKDITTVGVGLDTERFNTNIVPSDEVKQVIDKKEREKLKYLLYIGKIEDRRNIEFLIDVLSDVSAVNSNVRLIVVGKGEKEYVDKCFSYARKKDVYDKIFHYESLPQLELSNLYKNCDMFLLPTHYEIFGMVLLEAMYFGIPVITTLNGGSSTLIEHGKDGFICLLNTDEWSHSILSLLDDDKLRNSVSKNSTNKIKNYYTWDYLSDKFIEVYSKIQNTNDFNC